MKWSGATCTVAQEGARVVVSGRRDKQGQELVEELRELGAEAVFVRTDVRNEDDVRNVVEQTIKRFGRLDVAVNNALERISISRFEERDRGVYVELEAMGLSRPVPVCLAWLVNPVIRQMSQSSLATSLSQTREAVRSYSQSLVLNPCDSKGCLADAARRLQ